MDSAAMSKSSCLLFLLLIVLSVVIQAIDVEDHPHRSLGYGAQIPGNVKVPGRATCHDGQTSVSIKVHEGDSSVEERERERACARYYEGECDVVNNVMENADHVKVHDCETFYMLCHSILANYDYFEDVQLHDIPPALRGLPQIEVTFALKKDLRLHVSVTDKATMKSNSTSFAYGIPRRINHCHRVQSPSEIGIWKVTGIDPTLLPATRNYIHPDAVCLHDFH